MERKEIVKIIKQEKVVAILRAKKQEDVAPVIETVMSAGITVLEITSNTPGYMEEIAKARLLYPTILIGAGTIINPQIAKKAIEAGAQFLVSPNTNVAVIKIAHENDVPILVGAFTPTEVCVAHENGADVIKLFPAGNLGIPYLEAVKAPLDNIEYFAVGGIDTENMQDWLNAGASGLGYGCVVLDAATGDVDIEATKETAEKFVNLIKK